MNQEIKHKSIKQQNTGKVNQTGTYDYTGNTSIHDEISSENYLLLDIYQDDICTHPTSPADKTPENHLLLDVYQDDIISRLNKLLDKSDRVGAITTRIMKAFSISFSIR